MSEIKTIIHAPLGYVINTDTGTLDADDEQAVLDFCLSMSEDEKFLKDITNDTHAERIKFLEENGFELERVIA